MTLAIFVAFGIGAMIVNTHGFWWALLPNAIGVALCMFISRDFLKD